MTFRLALRWSFWIHVALVAALWRFDFTGSRAQEVETRHAAARQRQETYQRTSSASYADRLRRMNELVDRLDRQAHEREDRARQPTNDPAANTPQPAAPPSPTGTPPKDLAPLWEESRRQHATLRERYVEKRAKALAEATGKDLAAARREVEATMRDPLDGRQQRPAADGDAASEIAALHADAQRMLRELVRRSQHETQGQGLSPDAAHEADMLGAGAGSRASPETDDGSTDHTPLLLSQTGGRDTRFASPEDARRAAVEQNQALLRRFAQGRDRVRFTRRLGGSEAGPAPWVAPDAWYIIGPFPNPWRSQMETAFPPEMEIDRDAIYEGRDGRILSWAYTRARTIGVVPPDMTDFGVYYAFTEIHCAAAMDCWLAIGSDDYSKVWVNDVQVWAGIKREKIWQPTEGFRRVHFETGVNRILVRLENGINGCEFSVLIALE